MKPHIQLKHCIIVENICVHIRLQDSTTFRCFEAMRKGVIICSLQIKDLRLKLYFLQCKISRLGHSFNHSTFSVFFSFFSYQKCIFTLTYSPEMKRICNAINLSFSVPQKSI